MTTRRTCTFCTAALERCGNWRVDDKDWCVCLWLTQCSLHTRTHTVHTHTHMDRQTGMHRHFSGLRSVHCLLSLSLSNSLSLLHHACVVDELPSLESFCKMHFIFSCLFTHSRSTFFHFWGGSERIRKCTEITHPTSVVFTDSSQQSLFAAGNSNFPLSFPLFLL